MNVSSSTCPNSALKVVPNVLRITFPALKKKTHTKVVKIQNMLDKPQYVLICPPQTKYFNIQNAQKGSLRVDVSLDVLVIFDPKEVRHYYDVLQLHFSGTYLQIPLHADPGFENLNIPSSIQFGDVSMGIIKDSKMCISSLPLEQDVVFYFISPDPCSNFTVHPTQGIIPSCSKSPTVISVSYTAKDMVATEAILSLYFPTLCPTPFHIHLSANTKSDQSNGPSLGGEKDCCSQNHHIPLKSSVCPFSASLGETSYKIAFQEFFVKVQKIVTEHQKAKTELGDLAGMRMKDVFKSISMPSQLQPKEPQSVVYQRGGISSKDRIVRYYDRECETNHKTLGHVCSEEVTWFLRFQSLTKFMHAGNTIIIANRMKKRLLILKKLIPRDVCEIED